jgi:hypothetical protein
MTALVQLCTSLAIVPAPIGPIHASTRTTQLYVAAAMGSASMTSSGS